LLNSTSTAPYWQGVWRSMVYNIGVYGVQHWSSMVYNIGVLLTGIVYIDVASVHTCCIINQYTGNNEGCMVSTCKLTVTKSLGLLEAKGDYLNPLAHKLVLYAIARINPTEGLPKETTISAIDFSEAMDIPLNHAYGQLKDSVEKLWNAEVIWYEKDRKHRSRWIQSTSEPIAGEGSVSFKWADNVHAGLVHLKSGFKSYQLKNIARLDSSHAIRLYEILQRYRDKGYRILSIDELKSMLGIPDKYAQYREFKRRVIEPAVQQLDTKTNLRVSYSVANKGRKVTHLEFNFKLENQLKLNLEGKKVKRKIKVEPKAGLEADENTKGLVETYGEKRR
jgi:plasmid replication initiation protein